MHHYIIIRGAIWQNIFIRELSMKIQRSLSAPSIPIPNTIINPIINPQIIKSTPKMRIFINIPDDTGSIRKTRMTVVDCASSGQLLRRIATLCNINLQWLIVKLKQQEFNIRVIEGWDLEVYPLKNGSELVVEILPGGIKAESPLGSPSKLGQIDQQLELEMENTSADHQLSSISDGNGSENDWNKYFQQSLEMFLDAVRRQSIEDVSNVLKAEPQCNDEKVLTRIMGKKIAFLLNQTGECGRTALHWAVQEKNLDMVEFLLIKSSDPNVVSIDEYTPLQLSIVLRASSIFQTLVSHPKIDLNKVTKKGSALHVALENKLMDYTQKLIFSGANPKTQNYEGVSAVQFCQKLGLGDLKSKQVEKSRTNLPFILKGNLYRVSSFASRLKQRTMLVNPFTNEFIIFQGKTPEHNLPVKSIISIKQIKDKSWGMKKENFYFQVNFKDLQLILSTKNANIGHAWIQSLMKCVNYCQKLQQKSTVPIIEQLIEVLDDENNSINVHKHKIASKVASEKDSPRLSKKINILDLKPFQQKQQGTTTVPTNQASNKSPTITKQQQHQPFTPVRKPSVQIKQYSEIVTEYSMFPVTTEEFESTDYLRDSQLLGSVINSPGLLKSVLGKGDSIRQSVFQDKGMRPMVCFKDFEFLRQLGTGSFGRVFLARYKRTQKLFALKVLNKKKLIAKKQLKYAVGQANILKKVQSPFIIKLHYSFQTPSNLYIAIDYCPNGDLTQLMSDEEKLSQKTVKFYIAQLILAVEYLHKNKILYRDLKPQNILLGEDGFIRLTDFNLSKENNFSTSFCGSPAYLSPEMLDKKGVGFEADIYGIGCVFYEMLVGEPPFFDDEIEVLYENIRNGKLKFPAGISKPAKSLISGLLQRNISKRIGVKNMTQIKNHQFFNGFEWSKLQSLSMKLPLQLQNKITDKANTLQVIQQHGFQDSDYESNSSMINRIKNFTFAREI